MNYSFPITILITAITNFFFQESKAQTAKESTPGFSRSWRYGLALTFGLIHGMGFSNYLRSLLGREADIVKPLLAFNIGLEIGQLVIVSLVLGLLCFSDYMPEAVAYAGRLLYRAS